MDVSHHDVPAPEPSALLELIEDRRRAEVVDAVRAVASEDGLDRAVALLADVQAEVGMRWQSRQWTVADEHAATAIVDVAMTAAALAAAPVGRGPLGTLVVACVEDEWHVLPARMQAELLRCRGWEVVFLGASTPADHLTTYLEAVAPTAVALSCSLSLYLPGARRSIAACHAAAVPTVVGGAGFGRTSERAVALGADGWAGDVDDASRLAAAWRDHRPALAAPQVDERGQLALAAERPTIVDAAMEVLAARFPPMADYSPWQLARTREDLDYIVRYVESAMVTGDDSVASDFVVWLQAVLTASGLHPGVVPMGLRTVHDCVPATHRDARRLLRLAENATQRAVATGRPEL